MVENMTSYWWMASGKRYRDHDRIKKFAGTYESCEIILRDAAKDLRNA